MSSRDALRETLLGLMDRKDHWAWPAFEKGLIPLERLLPHFQVEWEVFVRDFPILLARVLGHGPPEPVRRALAANLYEEQVGGISGTAPHPALFLKMMAGCGYPLEAFEPRPLPPEAAAYRQFLDSMAWSAPWIRGAAVLTLFVEGSIHERRELSEASPKIPTEVEIEARVQRHPLVRVHRVDPAAMALTRVHLRIEGGHRRDAWDAILGQITDAEAPLVMAAMERALELWLAYRDEVAEACGVER